MYGARYIDELILFDNFGFEWRNLAMLVEEMKCLDLQSLKNILIRIINSSVVQNIFKILLMGDTKY